MIIVKAKSEKATNQDSKITRNPGEDNHPPFFRENS
jgi:hypothetical protein